jgi:hypothetical protein
MCKSSGMSSTRISRHVNAPRAAVYQAPSKFTFLIRVDINKPTHLLPRTLGFSKPNSKR